MSITETIALIAFLFPLAYSPGPGNLFFASLGYGVGVRRSLPSNFSYHMATWIVTFLIGMGLGMAVISNLYVSITLKYVGALYVAYLGYLFFTASTMDETITSNKKTDLATGAMLLLTNPKAYVIIALMFTQFQPAADLERTIYIATIFTINNFIAFTLWTVAGFYLRKIFADSITAKLANRFFGVCLMGVAVWMTV
ncbi:LysE family translocator [Nitrincola sp. MINF-07-Sa-05]|uniref:LysE family translocator n=1 Tax=Nitrincola salilacus TaxID=3400273 RepID=UPI00391832EB